MSPRLNPRLRSVLSVVGAVVVMGGIAAGGSALGAQEAPFVPQGAPLVGRTTTVCSVLDPDSATDSGNAKTEVAAVAVRRAPGREGLLSAHPLDSSAPSFEVRDQGKGGGLADPKKPIILEGSGIMATATAGAVFGTATSGERRGLMSAPCTTPATDHWFVGVAAADDQRTSLVLTNPDESQAEVDLRFYGPKGIVVVPGAPGVVIPGLSSQTISLPSLIDPSLIENGGPLTVEVVASTGRVAAIAIDLTTSDRQPSGADWHVASVAPTHRLIVPGVPAGEGDRHLVVVNPGTRRATVNVMVSESQGSYAPAGSEQIEVAPESTAKIDLTEPVAGQAAGVQLTSDQPVSAAVISRSTRKGAAEDFAVQPAAAPILTSSVAADALPRGLDRTVVLTNAGDSDVLASVEVLSRDGVALGEESIPLAAGVTETHDLDQPGPGYVVVSAPSGAAVYASLTVAQPHGEVAGLTTSPLVSPDVASRAPQVGFDPHTG